MNYCKMSLFVTSRSRQNFPVMEEALCTLSNHKSSLPPLVTTIWTFIVITSLFFLIVLPLMCIPHHCNLDLFVFDLLSFKSHNLYSLLSCFIPGNLSVEELSHLTWFCTVWTLLAACSPWTHVPLSSVFPANWQLGLETWSVSGSNPWTRLSSRWCSPFIRSPLIEHGNLTVQNSQN